MRGRPSQGLQEPSWGPSRGFGRPCWEAMWCISGLGRLMLQILEAILWPRVLHRAYMSWQHEKGWFRSLISHCFARAGFRQRIVIDMRSAESSLKSHTFAWTCCRLEPERLLILVDVTQQWPNKFCRNGGIRWHMVASGNWSAVCPWPTFASQNAEAFRI